MPGESRERLLIAVSQMLGEQPPTPEQQGSFFICEKWALDEILKDIVPTESQIHLTLEGFNRLMLSCRRPIVTAHFFEYFFNNVKNIEDFEEATKRYRIKAMWLYGNFRFAFKRLATSKKADFQTLISKTEPRSTDIFQNRKPFDDIEEIPVQDLDLLGYLTGPRLTAAFEMLVALRQAPNVSEVLNRFSEDNQKRTLQVLERHHLNSSQPLGKLSKEQLSMLVDQLRLIVQDVDKRAASARTIGKRNTHRYLSLPNLDVYVATSMRETEDFIAQHQFISRVFADPQVTDLKLRYFDPTLSFTDDRISKGLVEMLMLKRAKVTIYSAGKEDTLGKDSELASTLAQGKAVLAYVPVGDERRFKTFRDSHPLGLQIDVNTGVAHGIIVVRQPEECAKMLRKVILRTRTFDIRHENNNYQLVEKETGSVVRVVSDDPYLTHAFWTYFKHREPEGL